MDKSAVPSLQCSGKESTHAKSPDLNPDTTEPPDGVPALQDDSSEQGEVDGVHLQPLVLVPIQGTPGSIVHVPVLNARLKTGERGFDQLCYLA